MRDVVFDARPHRLGCFLRSLRSQALKDGYAQFQLRSEWLLRIAHYGGN
jgi:hypothetical protein